MVRRVARELAAGDHVVAGSTTFVVHIHPGRTFCNACALPDEKANAKAPTAAPPYVMMP
jgi:hypothetical protein